MLGLFYPYGIVLQAIAILHFARRRPDSFWLWIIILGGGLGALVYIVAEVVPDLGLLRGAVQVYPRRKRIKYLEAAARFAEVTQISKIGRASCREGVM